MMTKAVAGLMTVSAQVRQAAEDVSDDWPSVMTSDQLTSDLSLAVLDRPLGEVPEYRLPGLLRSKAREIIATHVAEFEHRTGQQLYSVSWVRNLLARGGLLAHRVQLTTWGPDLDEGCRYLRRVLPTYAQVIHSKFVDQEPVAPILITRAVSALADCMNNTNRNRPENWKSHV